LPPGYSSKLDTPESQRILRDFYPSRRCLKISLASQSARSTYGPVTVHLWRICDLVAGLPDTRVESERKHTISSGDTARRSVVHRAVLMDAPTGTVPKERTVPGTTE
jgi:hypothetical protein